MGRARSVKMLRDTLGVPVSPPFLIRLVFSYHAFGQTGGRTKRIARIGLVNNSELPAACSI